MSGDCILMGRIGRAHGVRGQVRIKTFTGDPLAIAAYGPLRTADGRTIEIVKVRPAKDVVVATLKGVADRTAAEALNGTDLYLDRDRLPPEDDEDTFYHADLIGMAVRDPDGGELGSIVGIHDFGAGDILEIAPAENGPSVMVPFTRAAVPQVDLPGRVVTVADFADYAEPEAPEDGGKDP